MVRINDTSLSTIVEQFRQTLQNSLITSFGIINYKLGATNYILNGFKNNDERIIEIVSIEGRGFDGNYKYTEDLTEGVDWTLFDNYTSPEIVADGYGRSSGKQVYSGITITDFTFQDSSEVYVMYRWQNPNMRPVITNLASNSFFNIILSSILQNSQSFLSQIAKSIDNFGINQGGEDLDRLATIVGLTRNSAEFTTGKVRIVNGSTNQFVITGNTRFVAASGSGYIQFKSISGSGSVAIGATSFIDVIAVEAGSQFNIGSFSIIGGFTDNLLSSSIDPLVVISNPPIDENGDDNLFDNGKDEETDSSLRNRIQLAFKTVTSSSFATVESAVLDTGIVNSAVVHDITTRKGIPKNIAHVYVSPQSGSTFSDADLSLIFDSANLVAPVGADISVQQVMNLFITVDMELFVNQATIQNPTNITDQITASITDLIDGKEIGEDLIPSTLLALVRSSIEVKDALINNVTVVEYSSEPITNDFIDIFDDSLVPTERNQIAVQLFFNSSEVKENFQYTTSSTATVLQPSIDNRISPTVHKQVLDYNAQPRESPLDRTNFYLTSDTTSVTFDNTSLINPTDLIINYNSFDDKTIDGVRVRLQGNLNNIVNLEIREGSDPNTATLVTGSQTAIVLTDTNGNPQTYTAEFSSTLSLTPETKTYWLIIKHQSGIGTTKLLADNTFQNIPFNPKLYADGYLESVPGNVNGTWEEKFYRAVYETFHKYTNQKAYERISISSRSFFPEIVRTRKINLTFNLFTDDVR